MNDMERQLTTQGIEEAIKASRYLKEKNVKIDLCISSPAVRTRKTAGIVGTELGCSSFEVVEELYYSYDFDSFFDMLYSLDDGVDSLMLVGHNPFITRISMYLTDKYDLFLHPASFVICYFDVNEWVGVNKGSIRDFEIYLSR
jgi:phosphohistidine phosphatase